MGKQWQTLFLGLQSHCRCYSRHEIKRCLLLGRKVTTNLDSLLKSRDTTLPTKFHLVKAMVFPVVMYGCESWTIKKPECWRIDVFGLWCWRGLLRVPWTASRLNQSFLKEISPEYSLEGLMLKLKLQYSDVKGWFIWKMMLMMGTICWKRLKAGGEGDNRGWNGSMASPTQWTWVWVNSGSSWWTVRPGMLQSMASQSVGHDWATELNWTELRQREVSHGGKCGCLRPAWRCPIVPLSGSAVRRRGPGFKSSSPTRSKQYWLSEHSLPIALIRRESEFLWGWNEIKC